MSLTVEERADALETWRYCSDGLTEGWLDIAEMPDMLKDTFREYLRDDVALRDAIIAEIASYEAGQAAARAMLEKLSAHGDIPTSTILAAMDYLDGEYDKARARVTNVLETEEYSLARLLHNGLEMGAPAALLQRSFTYYTPESLIQG